MAGSHRISTPRARLAVAFTAVLVLATMITGGTAIAHTRTATNPRGFSIARTAPLVLDYWETVPHAFARVAIDGYVRASRASSYRPPIPATEDLRGLDDDHQSVVYGDDELTSEAS